MPTISERLTRFKEVGGGAFSKEQLRQLVQELGAAGGAAAWADITGKPSEFPPEAHTHDYAATSHSHTKADVGLGNADNTSDAAKPVSTATQTALDAKAATSHNHDASYSALGHDHAGTYEASGAVATHAAAADPHTGYQKESEKGQANGYASLGADGLVPSAQLPAGQGGAAWGDVTGTLADQTDLQAALDAKAASGHNHAGVYEPADAALQAHVAAAHAPSNAQKNSDITKAEIEAKLTGEISSHTHAGGGGLTLAQVYPVGCIYTTTVSTNPATVFGFGTWAAFGSGRCLVGLDSGQTEFDTVEETGGAKTHTLTTGEMPAHSHGVTDPGHTHVEQNNSATTGGLAGWAARDTSTSTPVATGYSTQSAVTGVTIDNAGSDGAHNNLQPYIVVYFFKRTA